MKKLALLLACCLFFLGGEKTFSQERKEQLTLNFTTALFIKDGVTSDWIKAEGTRIIFNYGGDSSKVKMFINGGVFNFTQISATTEGTTTGGQGYFALLLQDDSTGERVLLQVFKDEQYGVRWLDGNGDVMQLGY